MLNEYKDMIHDTKHDLEKHLGDISTKLQSLSTQHREKVLGTVSQVEQIEVERDSTERCLEMCSQVLTLINNMRFHPTAKQPHQDETVPVTLSPQDLTLAETTTLSSLRVCSAKLSDTISELRSHQDATRDSLARSGPQPRDPEMNLDLEVDMHMLRGELDSTERRLAICEHASARATPAQVHVIEDIRAGNDSIQICASTLGDLFNVKRAITGNGGFQFFGSTTPKSLEQILAIENQRHFHRNKEQVTVEGDITSETGAGAGAGGSRAI